jgi:adenylate cyclase
MTIWQGIQRSQRVGRFGPLERPLRLTSGLVLFCYATMHFTNHAFGIRSIDAMQEASAVLLAPWQTDIGRLVLYSAFFTHGALGLTALWRRRHLRIPLSELWQLVLGLTIPLLLIPHAGSVALGETVYGLELSYPRLLYQFWVTSWDNALPRQYLLILVVWIHGCIGVRAWLRPKDWYPHYAALLASLATLVPVLALIGLTNAGFDMLEIVARDPAGASRFVIAPPGTAAAAKSEAVGRIVDLMLYSYVALVVGLLGFRPLRDWHARRFRAVRIAYPGGRVVVVAPGFSVLEASRWAGIPHASVCGGRGRCSTCRVRILVGGETLPAPRSTELQTLDRIKAPANIRLACQIRPDHDITVEPLVPVGEEAAGAARFEAAIGGGQELEIAALFVDMRDSTRLATNRLPYDALFLFDRYIQAVTAAVRDNGGHVTSIAGDGVMSVFGVNGNAVEAARSGCKAALDIWTALDALNSELAAELGAPFRVGIGLHLGVSVVGWTPSAGTRALQFLGDTGNIAAKLEAETKRLDCTVLASVAALTRFAPLPVAVVRSNVTIAGAARPIPVVVFRERDELRGLIAPQA